MIAFISFMAATAIGMIVACQTLINGRFTESGLTNGFITYAVVIAVGIVLSKRRQARLSAKTNPYLLELNSIRRVNGKPPFEQIAKVGGSASMITARLGANSGHPLITLGAFAAKYIFSKIADIGKTEREIALEDAIRSIISTIGTEQTFVAVGLFTLPVMILVAVVNMNIH